MIYAPQRVAHAAFGPRPRSVPLIGRGGQWGTDVWSKTPVQVQEGRSIYVTVYVKNIGQEAGNFRILAVLGKFSPVDYVLGGPLHVGGAMKFYWGAGQTPNPGNIGMREGRLTIYNLAPGATETVRFTSNPLKPIKDYAGATQSVLDCHLVCEVETAPGVWEIDWQVADRNVVSIVTGAPAAKGQIINTVYTVV